uniref:Sesquipedalian n=1 Tax=Saimiri boliviensis boliviensis TaxID=39432 RepID=A0A2K6SE20_SAIBB
MRYNEKELQALSRQPAEMAAELGMRGPKKGSVLKRRLVKLVVNFLFYFRTDEAEPVGALLLERCRVTREEPGTFSISFVEDPERKYHFECSSEEQCQEWMEALRRASYEFMRRSLIFYRNEIQKVTGKVCTGLWGVLWPWLMAICPPHRTPWTTEAEKYKSKCTCPAPAVLTAPSQRRGAGPPRRVNSPGFTVTGRGRSASEECGSGGPAFGTGAVRRRGSRPGGVSEDRVRRRQRLVSTKRAEAGAGLGTR